MSNIITDIKALKEETLLNLKNSKANNTVRAYKSDFNDFGLFCAKNGFKSLPSDPKIVSLYLTYLSTKDLKVSTIKRRLVSIGVIHKLKGHYLDTKHPSIIENLMGIKRRKGSIQRGKKPLLINSLKLIIKVIDEQKKEEIKKLRDRTIILIRFSGGFRRNEIVSLDYEDLDFVPESLKINLKRSKTDQFGEGSVKALPYFENSQYCPVVSISKWIEESKIISGALFIDAGTDFGSQSSVPGKPGKLLDKPGSGVSYGPGVVINSPVGPVRLEAASNNEDWRYNIGIGWKF